MGVVNTTPIGILKKGVVNMSPQSMREKLIETTIAVIAKEGLDKTTTKAIAAGTGINEAYIYRNFSNKDELLSKAFDNLDAELLGQLMRYVYLMKGVKSDMELRCRSYFSEIWGFLLKNREHCLAFVRYYYSPYLTKYSIESHKQRYAPLVERFAPAFKDEADVWMILNHILNVMLDFAVKVHNGLMSAEDNYSEHVFRVVYRSVDQYFKDSEVNYSK